jgi:predicted membrane channel-forming protein YqfA (hemolysin III family)
MRRAFLSTVGGAVIPILYYVAALGVASAVEALVGWERVPRALEFLLFLPLAWTEVIYGLIFTREMFDSYSLTFLSLLIFGNYILYAVLTYAFLGRFETTENCE